MYIQRLQAQPVQAERVPIFNPRRTRHYLPVQNRKHGGVEKIMQTTKIEYLTHVWNPIAMRCDRVSSGCDNCWHLRMANRLGGNGSLTERVRNAYNIGVPWLRDKELSAPFKLRKQATIGVEFMGDLFHKTVPFEWIAAVYGAIAANPRHQFVVLTKRVDRAAAFYRWLVEQDFGHWVEQQLTDSHVVAGSFGCAYELLRQAGPEMDDHIYKMGVAPDAPWPLENLILGTSVEDQKTADERIPKLLQVPAWKRMVSYEPALGPVEFPREAMSLPPKNGCPICMSKESLNVTCEPIDYDNLSVEEILEAERKKRNDISITCRKCNELARNQSLNLIVAGAETGPGARPADLDWFRSARDQCADAGVPFFLKQVNAKGYWELDGIKHEEWINE